jgi:alkyl sulfatase BDS1-like metallo-beta-lactamase superfamily hydrolase
VTASRTGSGPPRPAAWTPSSWGTRAPLPEGAGWGLDSLLLALQATADPAVVNGRYELRVGTDVLTVDGTSGSVRVRRGTADRPDAALTTDADTLHDVTLGKRSIPETVESGDLRLDGDPQAISGLTGLLPVSARQIE